MGPGLIAVFHAPLLPLLLPLQVQQARLDRYIMLPAWCTCQHAEVLPVASGVQLLPLVRFLVLIPLLWLLGHLCH